ncbi:hypothetical protein SCHPADRAFT_939289 [Schizopora paradoxa]|uniref:Transmembrane protein n=1 Tax=Schizopora paradoxa TaxID=27342 RepID=A0A0H2RRX0_9AGAM|nr:hypothetical protein SCHPADRAFT_939289 [Schizopora paradoxa]
MSDAVYSAMAANASEEEKLVDEAQHVEPDDHSSYRQRLSSMSTRISMVVLLLLSGLLMGLHDFLYVYLRKHSLNSDIGFLKDDMQDTASHVGNLFAGIANLLLGAAIGMVFVQVFWMRVRSKAHTLAEIDSAMNLRSNPFAFRAWRSMFLLALIPLLTLSNVHIIVFGSSSMKIDFASVPSECRVLTVNLTNADFGVVSQDTTDSSLTYSNPQASIRGYVTQVIMFNEALEPLVFESESDIQSYALQFNAPSLKCTDITSSVNSSQILPSPTTNGPIPVWNTIYELGAVGDPLNFTTASRDLTAASDGINFLPADDEQTVQCVFFNVTYNVIVNETNPGDYETNIVNKTLNNPLVVGSTAEFVNELLNFDALADTFARTLNGTASYDPNIFDFTPGSPIIVYSLFGAAAPGIPWSLKDQDMTFAIPDLMDAVSLSLLSDILSTEADFKPVTKIPNPCQIQVLAFDYSRARLLLSYGAGLLYTAICITIGFYAIRVNGCEESMSLSRLMKAMVHPGLYEHKDDLVHDETLLQADKGEAGEFRIKVISYL